MPKGHTPAGGRVEQQQWSVLLWSWFVGGEQGHVWPRSSHPQTGPSLPLCLHGCLLVHPPVCRRSYSLKVRAQLDREKEVGISQKHFIHYIKELHVDAQVVQPHCHLKYTCYCYVMNLWCSYTDNVHCIFQAYKSKKSVFKTNKNL